MEETKAIITAERRQSEAAPHLGLSQSAAALRYVDVAVAARAGSAAPCR